MDPTVIKKTQDTLGKVIKKPPLTDKLLSKPPFRFLHDILTEVIKNTGVLKGLYKTDELNSDNVKEKEAKMAFLQKAIDCVGILTGESLGARPSKIVAGQEAEKTNEFLQALGKACLKKMDSSDAVKKILSGEKPSSGKSRKKESSRTSSKERLKEDKEKSNDKKDEKESRRKDDKKERERSSKDRESSRKGREEKDRNSAKDREKTQDKGNDKEKERARDKERKKEDVSEKRKDSEPVDDFVEEKKEESTLEPGNADAENENESGGNRTIQRPSSAKGQRRRPTNSEPDKDRGPIDDGVQDPTPKLSDGDEHLQVDDDPPVRQVSAVRRSARPSSARPAPPKVKRNEEIDDTAPRLGSGKQMNAVIVDNAKDQDDEDDLFVVEDNAHTDPYIEETREESQLETEDGQHGSLVKKMLDSKREAEIIQSKSNNNNKEKPMIIDATRKKEKEIAQKEIEKLRSSIQTLCRSAHPLGKIMDYLQEDIDSMQKELEVWRKDNKKYAISLKAEQSITESDIEPLHAQLGELELEMADMVDRISSVKSNVIRNDEKIRDLINGVSR